MKFEKVLSVFIAFVNLIDADGCINQSTDGQEIKPFFIPSTLVAILDIEKQIRYQYGWYCRMVWKNIVFNWTGWRRSYFLINVEIPIHLKSSALND